MALGAHAIPVLDGAGWQGSKALEVPDNITLLPLPPYAPELNPIENVRACLRANKLAISVVETSEEIVGRCYDAWNFFANDIETVQSITSRDYAKEVKRKGRWHQTRVWHQTRESCAQKNPSPAGDTGQDRRSMARQPEFSPRNESMIASFSSARIEQVV